MEEKYLGKTIKDLFKDPPNEFRMMPFWFWNHEMREKEVTRQIRDHHEHGIGGEFLHPRHGRLTPYLGKRWMENVEAAADQSKELGMPCFLYDEDNWPSGPVSGLITGPDHPENRAKWLALFDEEVFEGSEKVEYDLDYQEISPETTFYAAIALPNPKNYPDFSSSNVSENYRDISEFVKDYKLRWDVPEGEWIVIFFCILINAPDANMNGYIDTLRRDTVKQFIENTHQKYVDYFIERGKEDYLGTVIPGIFTDEPSMNHMQSPAGEMMKYIPFTADLPIKFKEMHGYEFNKSIISLFYNTGAQTAKYRCDFWECATQMYVDSFYKQIYEFCNKFNWRFTGHVNSEGSFPSHILNQGNFFKIFENMHYGGVDQLNEDVRPDGFEEIWNLDTNPYTGMANEMLIASKLASSAAHLLGKPRVLVEAYGSSSWDITMASCKRINDYLILTGCDLFVPHDFAYSEDGYRKMDHPASFYHQPYYVHWKRLMDHNARLCSVLNAHSGVLQAEVLFFYPNRTFYAEMDPRYNTISQLLGGIYNHNADCLFRQQFDFEIASEEMILGGTTETVQLESKDSKTKGSYLLKIRDQTFKVIFLGATTCITLEFAQFLKKFYDEGGKIIATHILPFKGSKKGESEDLQNIIAKIFRISPKEQFNKFKFIANEKSDTKIKIIENSNGNGGKAIFIEAPNKLPFYNAYYPVLEESMRKLIPIEEQDVVVLKDSQHKKHAAYVMVNHKSIGDQEFYFLANTSRNAIYENTIVELNILPKKVELWNTLTGEIKDIDYYGIHNKKLVLELDFPPYQSYLFAITPAFAKSAKASSESSTTYLPDKKVKKSPEIIEEQPIKIIDLGKLWRCNLNNPNGAILFENWHSNYHVEAAKGWSYRATRTFMHNFHVTDLEEIIKRPVKLVIEGLTGDYAWGKSTFMPLVGGDQATVNLNGLDFFVNDKKLNVKFDFEYKYLDPGWIVVDISNYLVEGFNEVKMVCNTRMHSIFHVVTDPWRIIGYFECEDKDGIPYLKKPRGQIELKDLNTQGFSRYHGGFSYIQELIIPETHKGRKLILAIEDTTDCIEVKINGISHDVLWYKWSTDITSIIKFGEMNKIELIYYGIAQNMLQTNILPQGICGNVSLKIYP